MPESWNVSFAAMAVMALVGLFTVVFPLGLALVFWRRCGGRWRFFLLGCVVFPLFAMTLEGSVNRAVLYGPMGDAVTGNLALYALFGGAMAGIFEETGRLAAFSLARRWSRGPGDALLYGAGHGGIEAALLAGSMMLNNLLVALALRVVAIAIHLSLSVLVYRGVRTGERRWFPLAVLLHAGVDACAIVTSAFLPIAGVELVALLWAVGLVLLARRSYRALAVQGAETPENP